MKTIQFTFLFLLFSNLAVFSQSGILAGGAHVEQIAGCMSNQVLLEVYVVSKAMSNDIDREEIFVSWGDGTSENISRNNQPGSMPGQIIMNVYRAEHTYSGPGMYSIQIEDCCLSPGFVNLANSGAAPFRPKLNFELFNGQFQGCNSSPVLFQPMVDFGVKQIPLLVNFNAYDVDGDSLSYQLIDPLPELSYNFPDAVLPGPNNQFSLNEKTGTITWNAPQKDGKYLLGLKVTEYRFAAISSENIFWLAIDISDLDIVIGPNPVSGVLNIKTQPEFGNDNFNMLIYNVLGQVLLQESGNFLNGKHSIDVHDFPTGTYFLTIEALGKQWTKKFIKT